MYPTLNGEYEVSKILGKRKHKGRYQYLILWEGYPESQSTWEPREHLKKIAYMVKEYNQNHRRRKKSRGNLISLSKISNVQKGSINLWTQDTESYSEDDSIDEILGMNINGEVMVKLKPKSGLQHEVAYTNVDKIRQKEGEYDKLMTYVVANGISYYLPQ